MSITVTPATMVDESLVKAVAGLLPQLSSSSAAPTADDLQAMVDDHDTTLFIARDGDAVVGMLTLVMFRIPTGVKAWIEDVVVDAAARGRGVGEAMSAAALDVARQRGAKAVSLTSRPSREAANRLYLRIGFVQRETNMYRYEFGSGS